MASERSRFISGPREDIPKQAVPTIGIPVRWFGLRGSLLSRYTAYDGLAADVLTEAVRRRDIRRQNCLCSRRDRTGSRGVPVPKRVKEGAGAIQRKGMSSQEKQPPVFDLASLHGPELDEFARHFEAEGYCLLSGLQTNVTDLYPPVLMRDTGLSGAELENLLDPDARELVLPLELRQKLSRVSTPHDLAEDLVSNLRPMLARLLGPMVHLSRDFHAQFKCGATGRVGYGGYASQASFMEVHGAYQLHQDFTGASIPTSPAAIILWTGLNDCPDWPVRIYPRSHRLGLLCREFVSVDHAGLSQFCEPLEIQARRGTGVVFSSLLLHGTGSAGPRRRVSCDIRFFPSCPYLQSPIHRLVDSPAAFIDERLASETGEILCAPLLENLAVAGCMGNNVEAAPHSILNWANYLNEVCNGDPARGPFHLARFANSEAGLDSPETYISQFHGRQMHAATLERIREWVGASKVVAAGTN